MAPEPDESSGSKEPGLRRIVLPTVAASPSDIRRLLRELEEVENFLQQAKIRASGTKLTPPRTSQTLEEFGALNSMNWLQGGDRLHATRFLQAVLEHAPVVTISFAADPSAAFRDKIVHWFRANVHPQALIRTGLQPTIAAGCIVRTSNQVFDFSLGYRFRINRTLLVDKLRSFDKV